MSTDQLRLRISADGDPDGTFFWEGWCELVVEVSSDGFSGTSMGWFQLTKLGRFADALLDYPLSMAFVPALKGGYFTAVESDPADFYVGVAVRPYDAAGTLLVQVDLRTPRESAPNLSLEQSVCVRFLTGYNAVSQFSRALSQLVAGRSEEAVLLGVLNDAPSAAGLHPYP